MSHPGDGPALVVPSVAIATHHQRHHPSSSPHGSVVPHPGRASDAGLPWPTHRFPKVLVVHTSVASHPAIAAAAMPKADGDGSTYADDAFESDGSEGGGEEHTSVPKQKRAADPGSYPNA